jgi:alcohol dehydrogenase class IV
METARRGIFQLLPIRDVHYGPGCIDNLGKTLADNGIERALLITGTTLATQTELVTRVQNAAGGRIAAVFHDTVQHVHRGSVLKAAGKAREMGADGIVSFGGGTPNDTGKAVVMALAENLREPADFDTLRVRFTYPASVEVPAMQGKALPMIAISTTLSGGEFTHFAGVTDEIRRVKDLYINERLAARSVFLDPELTLATPLWLWLSTGMRSVDHCIEALCSTNSHPFTDALAEHALATLARTLRRSHEAPHDLAARTDAHIAAWMSVCGLANVNLGLSHGIGHQLGARNNVPHGVTSCVMMPSVMAFNRGHVPARQQRIAQLLGRDTTQLSLEEGAAAGADAVAALVRDLELPGRLREVGVAREDFLQLAKDAMEDIIVATNPRPVQSVDEVIAVLEAAYLARDRR